mgnify:CR=1 FL=1
MKGLATLVQQHIRILLYFFLKMDFICEKFDVAKENFS